MIEGAGDIWLMHQLGLPVCITTNGFLKKDGTAVMGRGVAKQAADRYPELPKLLGLAIRDYGPEAVFEILERIICFPVKPSTALSTGDNIVIHMRHRFPKGTIACGWAVKADPSIIEQSLGLLDYLRLKNNWTRVVLPRPGCGNGELDWETQVKPLCQQYGDWLVVVHKGQ